ncbi:MAG: site-specific integrase [Actinomycetota bacterium]|nr:site-specific integrase [Actinomycetota bacterium]
MVAAREQAFDGPSPQEAMEDYIAGLDATHTEAAISHKRAHLRQFVYWLAEQGYALTDLSLPRLKAYLKDRQNAGRQGNTLYHDATQIRCFLDYCRHAGHVPPGFDPAGRLKLKKPKPAPVQLAKESQLRAILRAVDTRWDAKTNRGAQVCYPDLRTFMRRQDYAILLTIFETGCRPADVCRLKLADVNWESKEVTFHETKERTPRAAPVSDALLKAYRSWLNVRPKASPSPTLFVNTCGKAWETRGIDRKFVAYCKVAGVEKLTPTDFRKYRTTKIAQVSPTAASQICGHSLKTLQAHYLGTQRDFNREAWQASMGKEATEKKKDGRLV